MIYLGAAIALASIPGWTSITIPAGWAALSILLPAATLWREARLTSLHLLLGAFFLFGTAGLAWTPVGLDGAWRLWQFALIGLAFHLGSSLPSIEPLVRGLAYGCLVSVAIAIAQWFGFPYMMGYSPETPAGLFFNPSIAGQTLALVAVACIAFDRWTLAILLVPGIALSQARGGLVILALGFVLNLFRRNTILGFAILAGLALALFSTSSHDLERSLIWRSAIHYLTPFGNGPGSLISLYINTSAKLIHPTDAHNDILQLLFEFGILALLPIGAFCAALVRAPARPEWLPLACFGFLACFAFPTFIPISACLGALCAGRLSACGDWSWARLPDWRSTIILRSRHQPATVDLPRRAGLSAVERATQ